MPPKSTASASIFKIDINKYAKELGKHEDLKKEAKNLLDEYNKVLVEGGEILNEEQWQSIFQDFWRKALSNDQKFYERWLHQNHPGIYSKHYLK